MGYHGSIRYPSSKESVVRVEVYRNLHNGLMSVREAHGLVLTHENEVFVRDASFVVQQAGRERVLREQKKNVHAFVRGELAGFSAGSLQGFDNFESWNKARYNPYEGPTFVDSDTGQPLECADKVVVTTRGVFYAGTDAC
jgi:hypothetical protein